MTDFLDRFEAQLRSVKPPRRWPGRRVGVVAGLVGVALAGPALAATQPWKPIIGDERRGTPATSTGGLPPEQLEGMAVLRRPQSDDDRGAVARTALRLSDDNVDGINTQGIRVMTSSVIDAALIPVKRFNVRISRRIPEGIPEHVKDRMSLKHDGLCVFAPDPAGDGGGQSCATWNEISAGLLPSSIGPILYGIVPDGVAAVAIQLEDGQQLSTRVRDNFYAASVTEREGNHAPDALREARWLNDDGGIIKRLQPPRPPAGAPRR